MTKDKQEGFNKLQKLDLAQCSISLCIIKKTKKKEIEDRYLISYVRTGEEIEEKLKSIISQCIQPIENVEEYTVDCSESVEDQVWSIKSNKTDFSAVLGIIKDLSPEKDVVNSSKDIVGAKAYAIVVSDGSDIKAVGFRKIPENWETKIKKGLIFACFKVPGTLEFLDKKSVLSIADNIDFISYSDELFIFSKKGFEVGLDYRKRIIKNAKSFFEKNDTIEGIEYLKEHVGDSLPLSRKIVKIQELGVYKNEKYSQRIQVLNERYGWGFQFRGEKIIIDKKNKESMDTLLSVLQNKRLYSEITDEHFDAESTKLVVKK